MSQVNNRDGVNKRIRLFSARADQRHENRPSAPSTSVAQAHYAAPSNSFIDDETELSADLIKDQLDTVADIVTQPIIEVPTKRLLHLKELGGNLFVSSSTSIYSKTLQKLFDRVLFTKSLNNDVNTTSSDARVFDRVLARSDDNDAYSTCTSLVQPTPATILILGHTACEHALISKLSQWRHLKIFCSPANSGIALDYPSTVISNVLQGEKDVLDFVDANKIDLVIALQKSSYYEELEARLGERGVHYLGCSIDTLALSDNYLHAKQFMSKHKIPTLDWMQCSKREDGEEFLAKYPDQNEWIVRATDGHESIFCKSRDETKETIRAALQDGIFGKTNQSVILEHGYSLESDRICTLYIVSDGDGDYTQLPIIESDPLHFGAYGPCPYLAPKQLSFIRRRIVERTLRCSPSIRHLFGFRLLVQGTNYNQVSLLDYRALFEEPDSEVVLSLCEPDVLLQYALDLPSVSVPSSISKKRRMHCVNTTISSTKTPLTIATKILSAAAKLNKVKIFHHQTETKTNKSGDDGEAVVTNGERIFNVLGMGSTLQDAQIQSVLACEYIKQHSNIDQLLLKSDIGCSAIEWYKTHPDQHAKPGGLTNGKGKKKGSTSLTPNKHHRRSNASSAVKDEEHTDNDDDEEEEESEPMDFQRAFGSVSDIPRLEHRDMYQHSGTLGGANANEGECYFDLSDRIDLKTFAQPVLVSTTINLHALAALFNLNDGDVNDSQNVFDYLGYELATRCANDLICARPLYIQCCSLPALSYARSIQRFYQSMEHACQQLNCSLLRSTTSSSSSFDALCTGVCNRELSLLNDNPTVQEGDLLIGIRCSAGALNTQGYLQLKDLFQKKNVHLNDLLPYRNESGEEKSFFSLLLQKSATLPSALVDTITELISNRTVRVIRYLKDVGLARTIESLLGSSVGKLSAELNGQQWPTMPPIFTWIYQHSGYSQDEMFDYFNCGIDYLLIVDHTKSSSEKILAQLTQSHATPFLLGSFISISATPAGKHISVPQQAPLRTVQLKNILFKYPKPLVASNGVPPAVKDRMKQPLANDKQRCAVLISTNDTSLLSLLSYAATTIECAFEVVLVLSTLASLSDIARVNDAYPSVVTKVIQPKKYAARNYDLDQKVDDELQLHGCELVILDRYACRLSASFITAWRGRLLNIYPSLLPAFRHSSSPIRDAIQAGVRITGVTVHFVDESDTDHDGPIVAQESVHITPSDNEMQLEHRLRILEQRLYPKAIDLIASKKIVYQSRRRVGKGGVTASSIY